MATLTAAQTQFIQTGSTMATVAYGNGAPPFGFVLLSDPATNIPLEPVGRNSLRIAP